MTPLDLIPEVIYYKLINAGYASVSAASQSR
jgi:hypothetical protein